MFYETIFISSYFLIKLDYTYYKIIMILQS